MQYIWTFVIMYLVYAQIEESIYILNKHLMSLWCGFTLVMLHDCTIVSLCSLTVSPSERHSPLPPRKLPCRNNAVITDFRAHENNGRYVIGYLAHQVRHLHRTHMQVCQISISH